MGGVRFESPDGLLGHSDADVLLHALMDAMLGAAALSDIGTYFPPSDPQFLGISSVMLLARVRGLVHEAGFCLSNADLTLVAERPRIGPCVRLMRETIAGALQVDTDAIGLKATTNESVGPEGRGEAISAHAVVLLVTRT